MSQENTLLGVYIRHQEAKKTERACRKNSFWTLKIAIYTEKGKTHTNILKLCTDESRNNQ